MQQFGIIRPEDNERRPTPEELLAEKMEEARQTALRGEVVLRIRYWKGKVQGAQAQVTENYPASDSK